MVRQGRCIVLRSALCQVTFADIHTFQSELKGIFLCPFAPKLRQEV